MTIDKQDIRHIKTKLQRTKLKDKKAKEILYIQNIVTVQFSDRYRHVNSGCLV